MSPHPSLWPRLLLASTLAASLVGALGSGSAAAAGRGSVINAVGAENTYANVISQIGGRYVHVSAVMSNPNTDPHSFEASPSVAKKVSSAQLVVQNGIGYDDFMNKIEKASPNAGRKVIDVQTLRGLPDSTPNPHLWYSPQTMPLVAEALANDLALLQPAHAAYFQANATKFINSLTPWYEALARFAAAHPKTPVATTEPVADYMLQAAGTHDMTPYSLQAAIMNGTDPAPQDVSLQSSYLSGHKVKVFLYNEQVTDSLTETWLKAAHKAGIPVVGIYETMPAGYDYQTWMGAEIRALTRAVAGKTSTAKL
ncbi:MAG: zinc ABC transporter substrate-binding protein [Acidimicrobiaceae bacterium]|nr:zinc ABC transporter substrate-binding protein [Acidimicrobiaceae bacterium]